MSTRFASIDDALGTGESSSTGLSNKPRPLAPLPIQRWSNTYAAGGSADHKILAGSEVHTPICEIMHLAAKGVRIAPLGLRAGRKGCRDPAGGNRSPGRDMSCPYTTNGAMPGEIRWCYHCIGERYWP